MFSTDDTIVAVATPPGRGGIGVVRISGPRALSIASILLDRTRPLEPRRATFGRLRPGSDIGGPAVSDEVVATAFPAPHSYTGQDVVEISAHGSPVVLDGIVHDACVAGARLANPGEFTLRAFLNGKRDLVQAEAVGDLVAAATPLQARAAFDQLQGTLTRRIAAVDAELFDLIARLEASLDFPDEGYHFIGPVETEDQVSRVIAGIDGLLGEAACGRMIREGAVVVVAGRPNVGKSSLFNALCGSERAIVTAVAGTTRDLVSERIDLHGLAVTLVDTAGARDAADIVEREGVERAARARAVADLLLVVLDRSEPAAPEDFTLLEQTAGSPRVVVANKCDRPDALGLDWSLDQSGSARVEVSSTEGIGLEGLKQAIVRALTGRESLRDSAALTNMRHVRLLEEARGDLARAREGAAMGLPEELLLADLQMARARLDEIVGVRTPEDVLRHIFENFCIGK